jgi:O6-methylguanine-DNA--protein-cysteine methyltransferase
MRPDCGTHNVVFRIALGWAGVSVSDEGVRRVVLPKKDKKTVKRELMRSKCGVRGAAISRLSTTRIFNEVVKSLQKYFTGECVVFDLPLDIRYYTAFQQAVWRAAMEVPYGETRSYAWIAAKINSPKAARAVGQALGANPLPIIIP